MRFVLIGDDPAVLPLVRAIAGHPEHTLAEAALAGELQGDLLRIAPAVRITAAWDELFAGDGGDAAIVSGAGDEALLAARQLGQSGTPLVVFPHVRQGAEFVYELTLIRDDSHAPLVPVFPRRFDAGVQRLAETLRSGTAGRTVRIEMERQQRPRAAAGPVPLLTIGEIEEALLGDADLLRSIGGDYSQVTALQAGRTEFGVAAVTVSLAGENLPESSWTLKAAPRDGWRISVTAEGGVLTLEGSKEQPAARLAIASPLASETLREITGPAADQPPEDPGARMLAHVEAGVVGQAVSPGWTDVARAFEIVEAGQRSVRRRRTIDLHFETTSERSQFKTHMTALGCGLLSLTLVGVIVLLLLGAALGGGRDEQEVRRLLDAGWTPEEISAAPDRLPGYDAGQIRELKQKMERAETIMRIARIVVFLPLFAFLVLQLLVFVARPSRERAAHRASDLPE